MELRKYRWSRAYESAEEELVDILAAKHVKAERWAAEEGEVLPLHVHPTDAQLWCAEGQLTVTAGTKIFSLQPGDALDIPAGTAYQIAVRFGGCVCYEAHKK